MRRRRPLSQASGRRTEMNAAAVPTGDGGRLAIAGFPAGYSLNATPIFMERWLMSSTIEYQRSP